MAALFGALTHASIGTRYSELLAAQEDIAADDGKLDLSTVGDVDSAAVALLLEIRRRRGQPLQLTGVPERLQKLITCLGAEQLLSGPSR